MAANAMITNPRAAPRPIVAPLFELDLFVSDTAGLLEEVMGVIWDTPAEEELEDTWDAPVEVGRAYGGIASAS